MKPNKSWSDPMQFITKMLREVKAVRTISFDEWLWSVLGSGAVERKTA